MSAEVTVGIDIGTSSVKALAVDADGHVLARARVPHGLHFPQPDQMEHDAAEAWFRGPITAMQELGDAADGALGIAISAMVPSCAAVDDDGVPITPGLLYGDARGRVPGAVSSNPAGSGEAKTFLEWCVKQAPGARGYWPAQAVASVALGGEPVVDFGVASILWPMYDPGRSGWVPELTAEVGVTPEQLPTVTTTGGAGCETKNGVVIAGGSVDAFGEQIICDAHEPGDVLVMCGTTLMTWALVDSYADVSPLWCIPWHTPGLFVVGGPSNAGGLFLNWAQQLLAAGTPVQALDPNRIPVWTPYPRGERVPLHNSDLRGSLHGLDLTMDAGHVRRAAYEAAGFVVADALRRAGLSPNRIVATGGGTKDPQWVQSLADCTQLPVDLPATPEGAAMGMAWFARMALGKESSLADARRWGGLAGRVEPDPHWVGPCAERFEVFRAHAFGAA